MCFKKKKKPPDTSRQEAELQRQLNELRAQFDADRAAQEALFNETRADQQARYEEQRDLDLAENQRMRDLLMGQAEEERAARLASEARAEEERAAVLAREEARAANSREYVTGRQAMIDQASTDIAGAYAGFDDEFFNNFRRDFIGSYAPQLRDQYADANLQERYNLQRAGLLNSTAGAGRLADLHGELQSAEGELASEADTASEEYRSQVNQQRQNALSALLTSGFVGSPNLPDGMTAGDELNRLSGNLGTFTGSLADSIRALTPASFTRAPNITGPRARAPTIANVRPITSGGFSGGGTQAPLSGNVRRKSSFFVR